MPFQRTSNAPPAAAEEQESYQFFNHAGVPLKGPAPMMYEHEYDANTQRMGKVGFGLFDMNKPEDTHFGRTFTQVMERVYTHQYELVISTEYNNGVVAELADKPPGLFHYLVWVEKYDTTHSNAKKLAQQGG